MTPADLQQVINGFDAIQEGMITIEDAGLTNINRAETKTQRVFVAKLKKLYFAFKDLEDTTIRLRKELHLPEAGESTEEAQASLQAQE